MLQRPSKTYTQHASCNLLCIPQLTAFPQASQTAPPTRRTMNEMRAVVRFPGTPRTRRYYSYFVRAICWLLAILWSPTTLSQVEVTAIRAIGVRAKYPRISLIRAWANLHLTRRDVRSPRAKSSCTDRTWKLILTFSLFGRTLWLAPTRSAPEHRTATVVFKL